jgi:hypothetical protein
MPIELTITTTKPENAKWFAEAYPEKMAAIIRYTSSFNGLISSSMLPHEHGENVKIQRMIFEDSAALSRWHHRINVECQEIQDRRAHNLDSGIWHSASEKEI